MYLTSDYRDIIELFNEHGVRYLVAGAYAMAVFGYARSTYDIDLWIDKSESNVDKVLNALDEFGVPFQIKTEDLTRDFAVIQIGVAPMRIDILTDIDGVTFDEAYERREVRDFDGLHTPILHIDDILKNKIASNRPKDQIDVIELTRLKNSKS